MVEKRTELVVDVDQQIYARGPLLWRGEYGTLSCLQKCVYGGGGRVEEREREIQTEIRCFGSSGR
jgi:hypothetical protein